MNGLDLLEAINDIDDDLILEATEGVSGAAPAKAGETAPCGPVLKSKDTDCIVLDAKKSVRKPFYTKAVWKYAACAAAVLMLVGGGLIINALLNGKGGKTKNVTPAAHVWTDQDKVTPVVDPVEPDPNLQIEPNPYGESWYDDLVYNSKYYTRQRSECTKVGEYLGSYQITGFRYIDEDEDTFNEEDNGEENSEVESITVEVFAIPDISTDYAVAVKDPDVEQYYVFARVYWADNFADYAKATQLATYMSPGEEFTVIRGNQEIKLRTKISMDQTLNTLFRNQDIPIFALYDMPNEFFAGTLFYDPTVGKPYDPTSSYASRYSVYFENMEDVYGEEVLFEQHPAEGSAAAQEFCKGKEIGTMTVVGYVNNSLCGEVGYQVYLYSGGFVVTDFFCVYVGPEAAADFLKLLDAQIPNESTVPN